MNMKLKKPLFRNVIAGSVILMSAISIWGISPLQWTIAKLDTSFINSIYAEDGEWEYEGWEYERWEHSSYHESRSNNTNSITNYNRVPNTNTNSNNNYNREKNPAPIKTTKVTSLSQTDIKKINTLFNSIVKIIDSKYKTDSGKLWMYKKVLKLIDWKISTLTTIKMNINNITLRSKYERKILLFSQLNNLTQEKFLLYINSIDLWVTNNSIQTKKITLQREAEIAAQIKAQQQAQIAAQRKAQRKAQQQAQIAAQQAAATRTRAS